MVFTSDHGYMIGHHGLQHKGNASGSPAASPAASAQHVRESIRVPLLVRWPGVVKPGTVIPETVSNIDTFASVLGMLGVPSADRVKQEGLDFSPLLRGKKIRGATPSSGSTTCTTAAWPTCA